MIPLALPGFQDPDAEVTLPGWVWNDVLAEIRRMQRRECAEPDAVVVARPTE